MPQIREKSWRVMKEKEQLEANLPSLKTARLFCQMHPEATHIEKREADVHRDPALAEFGFSGINMGWKTTKTYYSNGKEVKAQTA